MATRLIRMSEGTLVEVEVDDRAARPIAAGAAEQVGRSFADAQQTLKDICQSFAKTLKTIEEDASNALESAVIEISFGIETQGNLFVASATAKGAIAVKLKFTRGKGGDDD